MPKITKRECWDILEDRLTTISEIRIGEHVGEAKFAVAMLISAGRDEAKDWIESSLFDYYCTLARLHVVPTRLLVLKTLSYLNEGGRADFKQAILEA